jgi:hypothetical protein
MKKRLLKEIATAVLIVMIVVTPLTTTLAPQSAHAFFGGGGIGGAVTVIGSIVEPIVSGILNTTSKLVGLFGSLETKEFVLDPLAWLVVNSLIEAMSASIINWINSGFEGDPLFVTDIGAFLRTIELQEIVEFIGGPELAFICDPFELQVRAALELQFRPFAREVQCSLGDVTDNIQGLLDGDLTQGGLEGWIEVTTKPQNNPHGAFLLAAGELNARTANARANAQFELDIGKGFLSFRQCSSGVPPGTYQGLEDEGTISECEIVTPGSVIQEQLNNTLDSANRRLQIADEIDEIIGALIQQLVIQVMGGSPSGLSGLSSSPSSGSSSYTDRLGGFDSNTISSARNRTIASIDASATDERRYLSVKQSALSAVIAAEERLLDLQSCGVDLSVFEGLTDNDALRHSSNTLASVTGPVGTRLDSDIAVSNLTLAELARVQRDLSSANTPAEISTLLTEAQAVSIHSEFDIITAINDRDRIISDMGRVQTDADLRLSECRTALNSGGGEINNFGEGGL